MNQARSGDYRLSVSLLRQLHRLIEEGKGDEQEAEDIRKAMEGPWYRMNDHEQGLVRALSADLYALWEPEAQTDEPEKKDELGGERFAAAIAAKDWEKILQCLRNQPSIVPSEHRTWLRSVGWFALGESDIAWEFLRLALQLPATELTSARSAAGSSLNSSFVSHPGRTAKRQSARAVRFPRHQHIEPVVA